MCAHTYQYQFFIIIHISFSQVTTEAYHCHTLGYVHWVPSWHGTRYACYPLFVVWQISEFFQNGQLVFPVLLRWNGAISKTYEQWQPTSLAADSRDQGQRSLYSSSKVAWSALRSLYACTFSLGDPITWGMLFTAYCKLNQSVTVNGGRERLLDALPTVTMGTWLFTSVTSPFCWPV